MAVVTISVREEIADMLTKFPEHVLAHLKAYMESLVYDDEGVLTEEAVASIDRALTGQTKFYTAEEIEREFFPDGIPDEGEEL